MAGDRPIIYYLQRLWEKVGLNPSELVDDAGNARIPIDEAIASIKEELSTQVIDVGTANVVQAQIHVFEGEINRLTAIQKVPAEQLHTTVPRFTFGSALSTAEENVRKGLPDNVGTPAFFHYPTIPEVNRPITSADLPPMPEDFTEQWTKWEKDVEAALRRHEGESFVRDPFLTRLGDLPWQQRDPLLYRYDELAGFRHLREQGLGPVFMTDINGVRAPVARYPVINDPNDIRTLMLARTNFQYRPGELGPMRTVAEMYKPSARIPRQEVFAHTQNVLREHVSTPGKTLVFDVESAGLNQEEGIWQLAAHMIDEQGNIAGAPKTFYFHNSSMQWKGEIGRNRQTLEQYLTAGQDIRDFPEGLKDFFNMVEEADYVAGHNLFFDYGMIAHGIDKVGRRSFASDEAYNEFKRSADIFHSKFYDRQTGELSRVIDTHILAQTQLSTMSLAPELKAIGETKPFSLQNILLQTNLLERVRADAGDKTVDAWLKRGLHYADVDVQMERHLLAALREMATGSGPGLEYATEANAGQWLRGWRRERVIHSAAITPLTKLSDFESQVNDSLVPQMLRAGLIDFHPEALRRAGFANVQEMIDAGIDTKEKLRQAGLIGGIRNINMTPMEQKIAASRDFTMPIEERAFFNPDAGYRETFRNAQGRIWQRLKATFWDKPEFPNREMPEMIYQAGIWKNISKDFVTKDKGLITKRLGAVPTDTEWTKIQDRLAAAGVPFARSSLIERHLMASIGQAMGPGLKDTAEGRIRELFGADIASMGRYSATREFKIAGEGERTIVRIPHEYLIESGLISAKSEKPHLFALSPFEYTTESGAKHHEIGVMFRFADDAEKSAAQRKTLLSYIMKKHERELDQDAIQKLRTTLGGDFNSTFYGLQVATLGIEEGKFKERAAASKLFNQITQITGKNINRGVENTSEVLSAWAPLHGEEEGSKWFHMAGAFINDKMLSEDQLKAINYHAQQAVRYTEEAMQHADSPMMSLVASLASRDTGLDSAVLKLAHGYMTAKRRGPLLAVGAAVIGGIGYKIHKNRENRYADQVMASQPFEDENWYDEYENDINNSHIPINYRQSPSINPLSTAGVVRTLDRRKINHTNMSSDKYGYLFSRGYS